MTTILEPTVLVPQLLMLSDDELPLFLDDAYFEAVGRRFFGGLAQGRLRALGVIEPSLDDAQCRWCGGRDRGGWSGQRPGHALEMLRELVPDLFEASAF